MAAFHDGQRVVKLDGKNVVVTGAASGIGRALCVRFKEEGARTVVAVDLDGAGAEAVARSVGGLSYRCDVSAETEVGRCLDDIENRAGPVDLYCSNAGVALFDPNPHLVVSASNEAWTRSWDVNVMAHVYAARTLLPRMLERGGGYFLITVSAAGLLSQLGGAAYATTKHAAIGFAECLAIAHRGQGICVSVLCPQGVDTNMLRALPEGPQALDGTLSAEAVAGATVEGLDAERFLILPHPEVATYMRHKSSDYDRWLRGMARLRDRMVS